MNLTIVQRNMLSDDLIESNHISNYQSVLPPTINLYNEEKQWSIVRLVP